MDKSVGLDGWSVEFYSSFLNLIGNDLLFAIKDCSSTGRIYGSFNATFLALIHKSNNPSSFDDIFPISLCDSIYEIIAKIISL